MTEQIVVANKTDYAIRLVTYSNPVWEVVDIFTNAFVYIIQPWGAFGAFRAAVEARKITWAAELMKSLQTIWQCSRLSNMVLAGAGAELVLDWERLKTALTDTQTLLSKHGIRVDSRERISVHEHNLWNLLWYLVPSGWASALNSGNTYCMLVLLEKGDNPLNWRTAIVPSTALHNWVVTLDGIYTAKGDGWTPDFSYAGVDWTPFHNISPREDIPSDHVTEITRVSHDTVEYKSHLIKLFMCSSTIDEAVQGMINLLKTRGVHKGQVVSVCLQLSAASGQFECTAFYDVNVLGDTSDEIHVEYKILSGESCEVLDKRLKESLKNKMDIIGINHIQDNTPSYQTVMFYHGYTASKQEITSLVAKSTTLEQCCNKIIQLAAGCKQSEITSIDVYNDPNEGLVVIKMLLNKTLAKTKDVTVKCKLLGISDPIDTSDVNCSLLIDVVVFHEKILVFYDDS